MLRSRASIDVIGIVWPEAAEPGTLSILLRRLSTGISTALPISRILIAGIALAEAAETWSLRILLRLISLGVSAPVEAALRLLRRSGLAGVAEKSLIGACSVWNGPRVYLPVGWTKTFMRRRDRVPTCDHRCLLERSRIEPLLVSWHALAPKSIRSHRGNSSPDPWVGEGAVNIGESALPFPQRREAMVAIVMDVVYIDHIHLRVACAIPWVESVAGPARQPANTSEAAPKADSNIPAPASEPEERNIRRRPDGTIFAVHRSRPPAPVPSINKPATVVVWRPAPGLVGDPGPAVERLIDPAPISIGRPVSAPGGKPDRAVVRNV